MEKTTADRLVISPDRGRLLMSKELEGLVPELTDESSLAGDDTIEATATLDDSPMVIVERRLLQRDVDPVDEAVIGRLLQLSITCASVIVGMRVSCTDALAVLSDVRSTNVRYTGIQIHNGTEEIVKVPTLTSHGLISATIDDVTTAGTCTLVVTLAHG